VSGMYSTIQKDIFETAY